MTSRRAASWLLLGLGAWAGPSLATASPAESPGLTHHVAAWEPAEAPRLASPRSAKAQAGPWRIFVNFDGGTITQCSSTDPSRNCSRSRQGVKVLPFGGMSVDRAAVVQSVRSRMTAFNVIVTDRRPESGDYDMEMVGDIDNPPGGSIAGFSPTVDCGNRGGGDISYTFEHAGGAPGGVAIGNGTLGQVILQELAHAWGLEHVSSTKDLMYPQTAGGTPTYRDECFPVVSDTDLTPARYAVCGDVHQVSCGDAMQQNSYKELLAIFGPRSYEPTPPAVHIAAPAKGAMVSSSFDLQVEITDDLSPQTMQVTVTLDDLTPSRGRYSDWMLKFPIKGLPEGSHTIRLAVKNEAGLEAVDEVTFTVANEGGATEGTTDGTTGSGASAGDGATASASDGGQTSEGPGTDAGTDAADTGQGAVTSDGPSRGSAGTAGGEATGEGSETTDSGCGCRWGAPAPGLVASGLLIFAGVGPRRRRVTSTTP